MNESGTNLIGEKNNYLTAIEWGVKADRLLETLKSSKYNADLHKVHHNIVEMITELSKLEVKARQSGSSNKCVIQNQRIQESVDYLEKLILMLKLMD